MSRAVRLRSLVCGLASLLALIGGAASADILLVSPAIDQNDRIAAILTGASPSPRLDRVRLKGRPNRPDRWRRSIGERAPVDLTRFRLVVLENAASSGLADVEVVGGGDLLAALPGWVESGGHLLVMGGEPSFETYPGTEFASTLPVVLVPDPGTKRYHEAKRRPVEGHASDGTEVRRIHPVAKVRGDVLIRAGGEPFVVWGRTGRGEVTLVLSGVQEHHVPDAGPRESDFFASPQWERLLLERAGRALGRPLAPGSHVDPAELSPPMLRVGHAFRPDDWFGEGHEGTMVLQSPSGQAVLTVEIPTTTLPVLPETLRPGGYEALLSRAGRTRRRAVHIGTPVDLEGFDIRFFLFGHRPGPLGLAPGEAYEWAVELANIGFTSTVYASYVRRPQSNLRTMREILLGGLDLVYYQSFRDKSRYPNRWPSGVQVPQVAKDLSGEAIGWDIHSPAFRDEIDHLLDEHAEIAALPGIRALQLIEENKDGARRSPSLRKVMSDHGLSGKEKPGDAGWLAHEDLRSKATEQTYQRFRALSQRVFPGVPQSSYWPGSYWGRPWNYTHRVSAFAAAVDEFLGPGYGYNRGKAPDGWLSVTRTTNEIFNAHDFDVSGAKGLAVYAQGTPITPTGGRELGIDTWRETAWTALAGGATGLAYFDLPHGEAIRPLGKLHSELHRLGPLLASTSRRPASIAVLASWSTRTGGSRKETSRHHSCIVQTHDVLVYAVEQVDFVREEQLGSLPASLGAIVLTATPLLPRRAVEQLHAFVRGGGHLFVDAGSGTRQPEGSGRRDPWHTVRATGRVHDIAAPERCSVVGRFEVSRKLLARRWRERLAQIGIEPTSATPDPWTEARLMGDGDLRYWVFLNHYAEPRTLAAHARVAGATWLWRDMRTGQRVRPVAKLGGMAAAVPVGPTDAAVWAGTRRPTATLQIEPRVEWHRIVIEVTALDSEGRLAPDSTPVQLAIRGADGEPRLAAPLRSRGTRGGRASWRVPIPAGDPGGDWSIRVEAPLAGLTEVLSVQVASPAKSHDSPVARVDRTRITTVR